MKRSQSRRLQRQHLPVPAEALAEQRHASVIVAAFAFPLCGGHLTHINVKQLAERCVIHPRYVRVAELRRKLISFALGRLAVYSTRGDPCPTHLCGARHILIELEENRAASTIFIRSHSISASFSGDITPALLFRVSHRVARV